MSSIRNITKKCTLRYKLNSIYKNKEKYSNDDEAVLSAYQNNEADVFSTKQLNSEMYDMVQLTDQLKDVYTEKENNKKFKMLRDEYILMLIEKRNIVNPDDVFKYYPINVSKNMNLLAEYISNTIYCQFLEYGKNKFKNNLVIKLNSKSSDESINILRNFIKKEHNFKNLVMIFDYDKTKRINFLSLKGIYDENAGKIITTTHYEWLNVVQNAYNQLALITTHFHIYWHLLTAHIVNMAKSRLINKDNELLKLFEIANSESSQNDIFFKALEAKEILLKTPLLFNVVLYNNPKYIQFANNWINNFIKDFDIDTFYKKNITRELNTKHIWIPGFEKNLYEIKQYTKNIMKKTKTKKMVINKYDVLSNEYKGSGAINYSTEKLLQILMVVGGLLHSQTFVYQKIFFTDAMNFFGPGLAIYLINMATITYSPEYNVYGDLKLYTNNKYKEEFKIFNKKITLLKQKIEKDEKKIKYLDHLFIVRKM